MIIAIKQKRIDTDKDISAAERHILQKLFLWESMVSSVEEFRKKRNEALEKGWNNSGPIKPSDNLLLIIREIEARLIKRMSHR